MADKHAVLRWTGEGDQFEGGAPGGPTILLDGGLEAGPSPMDGLLLSLAACMGIDIRMILDKGRVPIDEMEILIEGDRAEEAPRRFTRVGLMVRLRGPDEGHEGKILRAIELSRDKYCSVFHTLRSDLDVEIAHERI